MSSSGYSDAAISKANHHGIDLYQFKKWEKPLSEQFPDLAPMSGLPAEHIRGIALNLCWPVADYWLGTHSPPFEIAADDKLFGPDGKVHSEYKRFSDFTEAMLFRSTEQLSRVKPVVARADELDNAHRDKLPLPDEPQWEYAHTLDTKDDEVYVKAGDENLYQIEHLTISGELRWEAQEVVHSVLERVPDGEVFAGALVAGSDAPGMMAAVIFPPKGRNVMVNPYFRLDKRHLNSIRNLKIATGQ